jgi:hypothetical protein
MVGSTNHGFASMIALEYIVMSSRDFDIGPFTLFTASWPARPDRHRCVVNLPCDGRRVKIPVHAAGIRRLPPMSVPTPSGLPPKAIRADSPPPEVSFRFSGLTVRPKVLLTDSAIIMAVGTLVLQYLTAPSSSSISTSVALYSAGLLTRDVNPTVLSLPLMLKLSLSEMGSYDSQHLFVGFSIFRKSYSPHVAVLRAFRFVGGVHPGLWHF